jgi:hypothetical protein
MPDRQLVFEDFADKIGEEFAISVQEERDIAVTLREAGQLDPAMAPAGVRPPFSSIFIAADPRVLAQRLYCMTHRSLGELSIFLVPVAKNEDGVSYQAIFN